MEDLSLHILDIAENSIRAGADRVIIRIVENINDNILTLEISDNGKGMDKDAIKKVCDPFFTTKTVRDIGLGIPLLAQAARECEGDLTVESEVRAGTKINAYFKHGHIDRKPLGRIDETLAILIASNPEIDFLYEHSRGNDSYRLDTAEIRKELENVPINTPDVIRIIKNDINDWLNIKDNMIK
jgi:anti-sigma regulatory factor (Ser/Thr protein kinase)